VGFKGVSLHSYRYSWAERAKKAGMPERFAMQALGHSSKAFAWAYSKKALVVVPSLENLKRRSFRSRRRWCLNRVDNLASC
jgi:integrase